MISQKHSRHGVRPGSHLPTVGYLWLSYRAHGWHTEGSPKLTCIRCSWHSKESLSSGCTAAPTAPQQTQTLGARPSPGTSVHASRGHTTAPRRPQMGGGGQPCRSVTLGAKLNSCFVLQPLHLTQSNSPPPFSRHRTKPTLKAAMHRDARKPCSPLPTTAPREGMLKDSGGSEAGAAEA